MPRMPEWVLTMSYQFNRYFTGTGKNKGKKMIYNVNSNRRMIFDADNPPKLLRERKALSKTIKIRRLKK